MGGLGLAFLRASFWRALTRGRDVDVRLGVDRNLNFSALMVAQGTNRTENLPRSPPYRSHEVPVPGQTSF